MFSFRSIPPDLCKEIMDKYNNGIDFKVFLKNEG